MRWSCEHLIMVWINAFVMLMCQLLPPSYCDLLHRSAAHLGRWQRLEHGSFSNAPQHMWVAHIGCFSLVYGFTTIPSFFIVIEVTLLFTLRMFCLNLREHTLNVHDVNSHFDSCLDGLKAPSGRREFWCDTADLFIKPSGRIMWRYPQTSRIPDFLWVFSYLLFNLLLCCSWKENHLHRVYYGIEMAYCLSCRVASSVDEIIVPSFVM